MRNQTIYTMIDRLNALRVAAGLTAVRLPGTSKMAVQVMINRAERGEFPGEYVGQTNVQGESFATYTGVQL